MKAELLTKVIINAAIVNIGINILLSVCFKIFNLLGFYDLLIQNIYNKHIVAINILIFIITFVVLYLHEITKKKDYDVKEIKEMKVKLPDS